jgi:DNA-binding IclR family transcriptional regulator
MADDALESVTRTCEIIVAIADLEQATLDAIADEVGYAKSVVYNYVQTLQSTQFLVRLDEDNPTCRGNPPEYPTYELSFVFLELGDRHRESFCSRTLVDRHLQHLAQTTGEYATFGAPEYGQLVYLLSAAGPTAAQLDISPGSRDPLDTTAHGRAALSEYEGGRLREREILFRRMADTEPENEDSFFEPIQAARERGYAIDDEETRKGVRSVAAPVAVGDRILGAIGVSGPARRFTDRRVARELGPVVATAAQSTEIELREGT